jgi:hypothetical protein
VNQRYWGFLSYSHANEAEAVRLHRALERYTLPFAVRRAHRLPRRLIPVFRDVDELEAAPGLTARLRHALDESRWLLVLCSRASAQSAYVNAEVEYFLQHHGPDRILCILQDDEPPGCFPPAIRALKDEPLAADMRAGSDFELALIKLIAAMAVISFTELRNRETARKRRFRWTVAAGLVFAVLSGVGYWDSYHRPFIDDYAHYVRRNGTWSGVDPISATAPPPALRYRFTRHGRLNPPERVDYLDAEGRCPAGGMEDFFAAHLPVHRNGTPLQFCVAEFEYGTDGSISRETANAQLGPDYGVLLGTLTYNGDYAEALTFHVPTTHSESHFIQFRRDERGFDVQLRFMRTLGVLERNRHGDVGYKVDYDDAGHVMRRDSMDPLEEKRLGYTWDTGG